MSEVKKCPYCGEEILSVAEKCKHCGEWLNEKSINKIGKYVRELSVIVIGIVITVGTGLLINNSNSKKDRKQYLDAIKIELENNAKQFDWYTNWLQKSVRYAYYINSNDKNSLNKDTLFYYSQTDNFGCGYAFTEYSSANFSTSAFEMFKSSGLMRQIKSKELLQYLWGVYAQIEMGKSNIDRIFQIKSEEAMKMSQLETEGKTIDIPMQAFHSFGLPFEMVRYSSQTSEVIKKTLSKLEEAKIDKQ